MPRVTEALSETINANTAEVKAYNAQAKATYFQSLVNEIKSLEKDVMLYGFKSEETDLTVEISRKIFQESLELVNVNFKAEMIGGSRGGRPPAIRLRFSSVEARNNVLSKS